MNEKPIIFNTEMVKAILDGRKVSTRRPVKCQKRKADHFNVVTNKDGSLFDIFDVDENDEVLGSHKMPCQIGDLLYVRETWSDRDNEGDLISTIYLADNFDSYEDGDGFQWIPKWKPSIHMPKKYARIWLKVTGVRVERIQDITDQEAYSEGMQCSKGIPIIKFKNLWNSIYDNWDSDPWVWVIDFEVVKS